MSHEINDSHPIRRYFSVEIHRALLEVGLCEQDVEAYLSHMLVNFLSHDKIFAIRDSAGHRLKAVADMLVEGDIRLNANSFDREREVHKHVGDYLLFWSGLFPEFLKTMKHFSHKDAVIDVVKQGQQSYYVASTFEHDPYAVEAPVLLKLSEQFEGYQRGLAVVRNSLEGLSGLGRMHG